MHTPLPLSGATQVKLAAELSCNGTGRRPWARICYLFACALRICQTTILRMTATIMGAGPLRPPKQKKEMEDYHG